MVSESLECKTVVLRVSIHCEGCKKKVRKVLQGVDGVYKCDIDAQSNKVTVAITGKANVDTLIKKFRKSGKQAEQWPEEQKQQHPPSTQSQETKKQSTEPDKSNEPTEKLASGNAGTNAAEISNPESSPEPNKSTDETAKPAQESTIQSDSANAETKKVMVEQSNEAMKKGKQQEEEKPIDANATVVLDHRGDYMNGMPPPQPVHVMSYNVARPSTSAAYCATALMPMPSARSDPSQQHMYSNTPYYCHQPSPYHCPLPSTDYYHCRTPQPSTFSPPRDSYGDLFSDDNVNSCSVM